MAQSLVTPLRLIMTWRGNDTVFSPFTPPTIFTPALPKFYGAFTNTTDTNNFYDYWRAYNADERSNYFACIAFAAAGNVDITPYLKVWNNSTDELYFWREDLGRNIRLSLKYNNNTGTKSWFAYMYGTYTAGGRLMVTGIDDYNEDMIATAVKVGFGYDDSLNRFIVCTCCTDPYSSNNADLYKTAYYYFAACFNSQISVVLAALLTGNVFVPPTPSSDPYADGGTSTGTDTGTGTFDDTSDAIADPSAPTLSPSIGNFVNQYVVSPTALSNFGTWLYSGGNIFDNLAKVFQSPMEAIINVGILPYKPTFDPNAYVDIKVGGLNSNVQARKITDNYEVVNMGTIDFDPFYGSALDYNPYTKCYIYLPYCGTFPLNVDEIMGHKISLKYYCDSLSGDCVAVISDEERVLEQFRGNTFIQVPITARDFSSIYTNALNSAISLAAGIATVAATGGVSAPVAVGMGTSMASNAMNSKTHYSRSGGFSGVAGFMSVQKPYVIITIPRQCLPDKQNEMQGYPLFVTKRLGDFSGFTKVYEIHLDGLDCTDAEAKEIYELLKGGVVL